MYVTQAELERSDTWGHAARRLDTDMALLAELQRVESDLKARIDKIKGYIEHNERVITQRRLEAASGR